MLDCKRIAAYIARANPSAGHRFYKKLTAKCIALPQHPLLYQRSARVRALRELVAHPNYIILYRVKGPSIAITNIIHARRHWPPLSWRRK